MTKFLCKRSSVQVENLELVLVSYDLGLVQDS